MNIKLKTSPRGNYEKFSIESGCTLESIYFATKESLDYPKVLGKVNNKFVDLNFTVKEDDVVELLDLRTQAANLTYQNSAILIFLAATEKVLGKGEVKINIDNSLNQGLYVHPEEILSKREIRKIEEKMKELVEENIPIKEIYLPLDEGLEILKEQNRFANIKELQYLSEKKELCFYDLDGYRDYFYSPMAPSTGYITKFQLCPYNGGLIIRLPGPRTPDKIPEYEDQKSLAKAFEEQARWNELTQVNYVADLNEKILAGKAKELMMLSEALHEKKIAEIADMVVKSKKRIILIAGPSSSGKTTFAKRLGVQLRVAGMETLYLGTDDYFIDRKDTPLDENGEPNYEDLEAIDIKLFNDNMNDLLNGKEVDLPTFDFITGEKKFGKRITRIEKNQAIIIEGIHGLNEKLTEYIPHEEKFKIYISPLTQLNIDEHVRIPTTDERMLRRLVRDFQFRNHEAKNTLKDWPKVRAGEDKNIFPYSGEADVLFNSYHIYEIAVLKKYAQPLLESIKPEDEEYGEAQRMLRLLEFFVTIEDDDVIINNSIIREFIGGSIFI